MDHTDSDRGKYPISRVESTIDSETAQRYSGGGRKRNRVLKRNGQVSLGEDISRREITRAQQALYGLPLCMAVEQPGLGDNDVITGRDVQRDDVYVSVEQTGRTARLGNVSIARTCRTSPALRPLRTGAAAG